MSHCSDVCWAHISPEKPIFVILLNGNWAVFAVSQLAVAERSGRDGDKCFNHGFKKKLNSVPGKHQCLDQ